MKITTSWRRGLPLLLIISLTLSILSILPVIPSSVQAVGFNPECKVDLDPSQSQRGKTITASIICENIQSDRPLFAYQGTLRYNLDKSKVKLSEPILGVKGPWFDGQGNPTTLHPLQDTICDPDLVGACDVGKLQFDDVAQVVNWEVVLTGYPVGFSGSALLLRISFEVLADKGNTLVQLDISILDGTFTEIPHTETDGNFRVGNAFIRTSPSIILRPVGEKFEVFVTVENVEGLVAHTGMLKYDPRVIQVQPPMAPPWTEQRQGTVCELDGACEIIQLQFNDQTGEITWEIVLGFPLSTDPAGPGKSARLIRIVFFVVDDTGTSLLEFKANPKTGPGPCDVKNQLDKICLLDVDFDQIPHVESDGSFGVLQTRCQVDPSPVSAGNGEIFSVDVLCDNVQGLFAYSGVVTVDPTILKIVAASHDAPGLVCHEAACEIIDQRFNDLTGEVFFEIVIIGRPTGFSGDARLKRISFEVIDDRGTTPIALHGECETKGQPDQICLLDPTFELPGIAHTEDDGVFTVGTAEVRVEGSSGVIIRPVGDTFNAKVILDTSRGIFAHAGTLKYQTDILTAKAADVTGPGTVCENAFCEVIDLTINDAAGEVTWEVAMPGFPTGFRGVAALIIVTFNVDAKGMTLLELRSPPGEDCTTGSEHDQVCILDETISPSPHTEFDGLFSVNTPVNPTAVLLPEEPQKVSEGEKVLFGAFNSVDNNSPPEPLTVYQFSVFNGTDVVVAQSSGSFFFSFIAPSQGIFTVSLVVCNESRLCSTNSEFTFVTVNPPPKRPPVSDFVWDADQDGTFENGQVVVGRSVTFKSTSFDPQGQALISWDWDFQDGTQASGTTVKHTFTLARIHTVSLKVCNESKICETEPKDITVTRALVADLIPPLGVYVTEPATFTFGMTGGVPGYSCIIDFGDGTFSFIGPCLNGSTTTHTYTATGSYTVTLTVTDSQGASDADSETISVQPEPRFVQQRLSWKHHLSSSSQLFTARISNPSKFTVNMILVIIITRPDFTLDVLQVKSGVLLPPGSDQILATDYQATMLGRYCFTATLRYQVDFDGNGIIDLTGTGGNSKSGCFQRA